MNQFPPVFDYEYYIKSNHELIGKSEKTVKKHYQLYAETQGRTSCEYDTLEGMRELLRREYKKTDILEIGPFDNPMCEGENVKYFDVLNSEELIKRAIKYKRKFNRVPKKIHYVSSNGDLSIVDKEFDIVFSAHVIEHQPDLIRHFQLISKILQKNGLYIMYIPDKRYCFDYYIPETIPSEIVEAYTEARKLHTLRSVMEHRFLTTKMTDPVEHWTGNHGDYMEKLENWGDFIKWFSENNTSYIDVHAWQFTPDSFKRNIEVLYKLNFIDLCIYRLCHTVWGRYEFCAVLQKTPRC